MRAAGSTYHRKCGRRRGQRGAAKMVAAKRKPDAPAARPKKRAKRAPSAPEPDAKPDSEGAGPGEYSIPPPVSQVPPSPAAQGGAGRAGPGVPARLPSPALRLPMGRAPRLRARAGRSGGVPPPWAGGAGGGVSGGNPAAKRR